MAARNAQLRYLGHAEGELSPAQFEQIDAPLPAPREGELLLRNVWLSLDPYLRRQMRPGAAQLRPGDLVPGRAMARVLASRDPRFAPGDWVRGAFGWQQYATAAAAAAERIELGGFPPSTWLGVLGSSGITAWVGLFEIARIRPGETVLVSAVTGAVGSAAAALAAAHGCRVVGVAGGPGKCALAVAELHCEACVDHRDPAFAQQLAAATPDGVDVDFENVGGAVFDAVLRRMNEFGRVAVCGLVSQYGLSEPYALRNTAMLLDRSLRVQGFRVADHAHAREAATAELKQLLRSGGLVPRESITEGLERTPEAFIAMLRGAGPGKQLVRLAPDDAA